MEDLLNRFFRDEHTSEEQQEVVEYLQNPSNELVLKGQLWQTWNRLDDYTQPEQGLDRIWSEVEREIGLQPTRFSYWKQLRSQGAILRCLTKLGLALVFFAAAYLFHSYLTGLNRMYNTGPGQRLTVQLPDQTTAVLEENTSLSFSVREPFMDSAVELTGTATFHIAPQKEGRHFLIQTFDGLQIDSRRGHLLVASRSGSWKVLVKEGATVLTWEKDWLARSLRMVLYPGDITQFNGEESQLVCRRVSSQVLSSSSRIVAEAAH